MLPQFYQKLIPPTKPKTKKTPNVKKNPKAKPQNTLHIVIKVRHVPRYTPIQQKQK